MGSRSFFRAPLEYIADRIASRINAQSISSSMFRRNDPIDLNRRYYEGDQPQPLRVEPGKADDNIIVNLAALAVDRANAMLFGGRMKFTFADAAVPSAQYLQAVWAANKQQKFNLLLGQDGEVFGTYYAKIIPEGLDVETVAGVQATERIILLDPRLMTIVTDPLDSERVLAYIWEMKVPNEDRVIREVTRRVGETDMSENEDGEQAPLPDNTWVIEMQEAKGMSARFETLDITHWPYEFPPILHGINLPGIHSVYGRSGLENARGPQDKYNLVMSSNLKILRYHAYPRTWGKGINTKSDKRNWGADEMVLFSSPDAMLSNLEMNSDLASSRGTAKDLRQSLMDQARVVDVQSYIDRLGNLTNFSVRVLYSDALFKNGVRQLLYGEFIDELNRRLLLIRGFNGLERPTIQWGEDMPADEEASQRIILADLSAGLCSRETAAIKRGYVWNGTGGEKEKIAGEKLTSQQQDEQLGDFLMSSFNRGGQ